MLERWTKKRIHFQFYVFWLSSSCVSRFLTALTYHVIVKRGCTLPIKYIFITWHPPMHKDLNHFSLVTSLRQEFYYYQVTWGYFIFSSKGSGNCLGLVYTLIVISFFTQLCFVRTVSICHHWWIDTYMLCNTHVCTRRPLIMQRCSNEVTVT